MTIPGLGFHFFVWNGILRTNLIPLPQLRLAIEMAVPRKRGGHGFALFPNNVS